MESAKKKSEGLVYKKFELNDTSYLTTFTKKFENHKPWVAPNPKLYYSFIPGKVLSINLIEGQIVKKGEPMMVLESMKMNNIIRVPVDGKVKKISVKVDEVIPKNHLMVEFE
jgi:biotin carboxyl carrier protein